MLLESAIPFLVLLLIVVVVHEFGHLWVARKCGVFCEAFSVGYGPILWKKKDKHGTEWRLSALPLGGYVKMFGDADATSIREAVPKGYTEADMDQMSAHRKEPWKRLLIAAGGPLANFLFAICVLFFMAAISGLPKYDTTIAVAENSLAQLVGLKDDDKIMKANELPISDFIGIREQIAKSQGNVLRLEVKRGEELLNFTINMFEEKDGQIVPLSVLGISPKGITLERVGIWDAAVSAVSTTFKMAAGNIIGIFQIITGKMSVNGIGGIISIFKMSSESAKGGILNFIFIIALISVTLGAINLLPIPVLDGGSIVISAIEWILGRQLNKKFVEVIFMLGLAIVVILMIVGTWNDLVKCNFFDRIVRILK
jgi:regulator of sigma E protease